ncbi:hypothetical protein [Georgenia yuyongxinii]|uniref:DUF2384 domain-containing protein n=1 Tax=Georgenia yuyongxinii TaxID=2589797 RepID=A0A552WUA7_9MICO|nr:hypothetical protein [Georgenia yuyongxinii]TRW46372.1 hypothetical protein FJ693_05450 [Georgenia yuyongxinii]
MTQIEAWLLGEPPLHELVRLLNAHLGTTLVAALSGATVSTLAERWAVVDGLVPSPPEEERLRAAHRIWMQLAAAEGSDVARAWFIGTNPVLDGIAPVMALREGRTKDVQDAATAFTTGTWAD